MTQPPETLESASVSAGGAATDGAPHSPATAHEREASNGCFCPDCSTHHCAPLPRCRTFCSVARHQGEEEPSAWDDLYERSFRAFDEAEER